MNAQDILKYGNNTLLTSLNGLPESDMNTAGVCGRWSVREIIAHLASYELMLIDVLKSLEGESPTPALDALLSDYEGFNDRQVDARAAMTAAELLAEYHDAHAQAMERIAGFTPERCREAGSLPWYGAEYSLDDFLVYTFYGHKREHSAQVAVFRDKIGR